MKEYDLVKEIINIDKLINSDYDLIHHVLYDQSKLERYFKIIFPAYKLGHFGYVFEHYLEGEDNTNRYRDYLDIPLRAAIKTKHIEVLKYSNI